MLLVCSFRQFIILVVTFQSLVYVKLIFVCSVKKEAKFIFHMFPMFIQDFQHDLFKRISFPNLIALVFSLKWIGCVCVGLCPAFLFWSTELFALGYAKNKYINFFDYYITKISKSWNYSSIFFFSKLFWLF